MPPSDTQTPEKPTAPKNRGATLARQFALAVELPFVLVAAVGLGGAMGYWLDARMHTSPLFLLVLGGLGFAAGILELVRRLTHSGSGRGS